MSRIINITFQIEDNDQVEYAFEKELRDMFGSSVKDYTVIPDTKNLYETDSHFKKLTSEYYKAKKIRNDYINNHNFE